MPDSIPGLAGFTPAEALWRLLRLKGFRRSFQAFQETHPLDTSPEAMVMALEVEGVHARVAVIQADELTFLELPSLVQLTNATWILLLNFEGGGIRVEIPKGEHYFPLDLLTPILSGNALDLSPALPEGKALWARMKALVGHHGRSLTQIAVATVILQILALALPEITGVVMNRALPDGAESILKLVAAGVFLVAVFQAWTGWIREQLLLYLTARLEASFERGFLEHLLRLPFSILQGKSLGDMLQAFWGLTAAREQLEERAIGALLDGLLALVYVTVMAIKLLAPTLVVVLVASLMVGLSVVVGRAQARQEALEVEAQANQRGYLTELIAGIGTLKAAGAEGQGLDRWLEYSEAELRLRLKRNRMGLWSEVGLTGFQHAMTGVLLIWGGHLVLKGELRIGTLFAFLQLASGFLGAVFGLVNTYQVLLVLRPQLAKTEAILEIEPEKRSINLKGETQTLKGPVVMEDVWFRYTSSGPWILEGYNLLVEAGEEFLLTGPSGFGKSTVLRLLAGLYAPEKGTISIDGLSPPKARQKVLYLPQFVQLYGGSILENLRLLSGGASREGLMEVAQQTGLHALVKTFPMNYDTLLPTGARNLSGGQRQLIALTGALASGRGLMLLDEATANLDDLVGKNVMGLFASSPFTVVAAQH